MGSNYLFREFKKRISIIFTNNGLPKLKSHNKSNLDNLGQDLYTKFEENAALKTLLMKMIIITIDLDRILINESVKYYQGHIVHLQVK